MIKRTVSIAVTASMLALCALLAACFGGSDDSSQVQEAVDGAGHGGHDHGPPPPADALRVVFTYGSEKKAWLEEMTARWNREQHQAADGRVIYVESHPMGSGECIDEILEGRRQAHIISPASQVWITRANATWRAKTGEDLVARPRNLVLSPVVIAMWKPMAEAMGWPDEPIGWADCIDMAKDPEGWATKDYPQWGSFKFGHTHPEYSNSGIISLCAEVYAGAGKRSGLTLEDVRKPAVAEFLGAIEKAVVHYGRSTGFFGRRMMKGGAAYLSAAVLYENMVIESYAPEHQLEFPIVAIYPEEGTFWSDHPAAVVERDWVTDVDRQAATAYLDWLLDEERQRQALRFGFRPALPEVAVASPIDTAHGVDPEQPVNTLAVPEAEVIDAIVELWHREKKKADVVLVIDTSGSMREDGRIANARKGAAALVEHLGDGDRFSLLPFNNNVIWAQQNLDVTSERQQATRLVSTLAAAGGTALYDAVAEAHTWLTANRRDDAIAAVVVLTDGADRDSSIALSSLVERIRSDHERRSIRVFTIGYGAGAQKEVLERIAGTSQAKFYTGEPDNITHVFRDIATFF